MRRRVLLPLLALAGSALVAVAPQPAHAAPVCPSTVRVPGAEQQDAPVCLPDITTPGLQLAGRTDASDWLPLSSARSAPQRATAGMQIDGYFPDDSTTNTTYSKNHDAQFVMRFPVAWNGGLVVTGAPGVRKQYATDRLISDWAVANGYAYAATDKGNTGTSFFANGPTRTRPGDAVLEWHERVTQLAVAAKQTVAQVYGSAPGRTYMTGISNGGYLTRWQLEKRPDLYDGGVDWEGTLFTPDVNLLTFLPPALKHYPDYRATGSRAAYDAMVAAGFSPDTEPLWEHHYGVYWDLTQRVYREEFDPDYDGATRAGTPFCQSGPGCDAEYDYASRPQSVRDAVTRVSLTGRIGRPMITLHGTRDALLPIGRDSDLYTAMVDAAGRDKRHRYYVVEDGNHVDQLADVLPHVTRPILPCYLEAFTALEGWVERGVPAPEDGFIARPASGDDANTCALPGR